VQQWIRNEKRKRNQKSRSLTLLIKYAPDGFGVYNPSATAPWVCGFFQGGGVKGDGPYSDSNCFIGPLKWMKLKKQDTFEYEYFLILGTVEDVRGFAYEQQGKKLKRK
jgi:hypothetical protein